MLYKIHILKINPSQVYVKTFLENMLYDSNERKHLFLVFLTCAGKREFNSSANHVSFILYCTVKNNKSLFNNNNFYL
jgi:hypothetical protein